ncbi:putative catechol O-methyltransferase [Rosa chinensis]|uniref:Putative catechol O-methyltransferase n=1 Tax=Rosa chinensis TaxID=74649 RepID=A0A2P6RUB7_ROSCH|nr:putative catechol O-methyltransferase [Rosa chinensis]
MTLLNPNFTNTCYYMSTWFQNDDPMPFNMAYGMTFWDYITQEPSRANLFNVAMASDTRLMTSVSLIECKGVFEGLKSLVDIGGVRSLIEVYP